MTLRRLGAGGHSRVWPRRRCGVEANEWDRGSHRMLVIRTPDRVLDIHTYRELVHLIGAAGFEVDLAEPWTREPHILTFVATAR